ASSLLRARSCCQKSVSAHCLPWVCSRGVAQYKFPPLAESGIWGQDLSLAQGAADIGGGVHRTAVLVDLKVQVGPGGAARAAHGGNHLAALDQIADLDLVFLVVGVAGDIAFAVVD